MNRIPETPPKHTGDAKADAFAHRPGVRAETNQDTLHSQNETIQSPRRRRLKVPIILFVLTCASTFWVGVTDWQPIQSLEICRQRGDMMYVRQLVLTHWSQGLLYMGAVISILLLHELGHFVMTLIYRVPATVPIFLPFPLNPIGTLGAVIGMQGTVADRKQIFDIGIAGPLAGLVIAIPMAFLGVSQLDLTIPAAGGLGFQCPLFLDWLIRWMEVPGYNGRCVWLSQLNPYFSAAWVGCLVTGLNMIPVGQLDGGHITYTLFGEWAHTIAEAMVVLAIAFMVYYGHFVLVIMVGLLLLVGTDHPPTRDDTVQLGGFRWALGLASLVIPILCFPPMIFEFPS